MSSMKPFLPTAIGEEPEASFLMEVFQKVWLALLSKMTEKHGTNFDTIVTLK